MMLVISWLLHAPDRPGLSVAIRSSAPARTNSLALRARKLQVIPCR